MKIAVRGAADITTGEELRESLADVDAVDLLANL
jgi:hypothetical protein